MTEGIYDVVLRGEWTRTRSEVGEIFFSFRAKGSKHRLNDIKRGINRSAETLVEGMENYLIPEAVPGEKPSLTVSVPEEVIAELDEGDDYDHVDVEGTYELKVAVYANNVTEAKGLALDWLTKAMARTFCRSPEVEVA